MTIRFECSALSGQVPPPTCCATEAPRRPLRAAQGERPDDPLMVSLSNHEPRVTAAYSRLLLAES